MAEREDVAKIFFKHDCPKGEWEYAVDIQKEKWLAEADLVLEIINRPLPALKLIGDEEIWGILEKAVELIKSWHNLGATNILPKQEVDKMWQIYYEKSPEMKEIRQVLKSREAYLRAIRGEK